MFPIVEGQFLSPDIKWFVIEVRCVRGRGHCYGIRHGDPG
jgi:hypothetical protein